MEIRDIAVVRCTSGGFVGKANDGVRHVKELPTLSVVQATEGYYSIGIDGEKPTDTSAGGVFIAPSFRRQEIIHHTDAASGTMGARWVFLDVILNGTLRPEDVFSFPLVPGEEDTRAITKALDAYFSAEDVCGEKIALYGLLRVLLGMAEEVCRRETPALRRALRYISDHYAERITVEILARHACVSPSRLYTVFRESLGVSPIVYLNDFRLTHACAMLEAEDCRVYEIAQRCGFSDSFYFSRLFRRKFGVPPGTYKKMHSSVRYDAPKGL